MNLWDIFFTTQATEPPSLTFFGMLAYLRS